MKETVLQHLFMLGLMMCLTVNREITPEMSSLFEGKTKGSLDFYINGDLNWGLELLVNKDRFKAHSNRFLSGGNYSSHFFSNYRLVDFRTEHIGGEEVPNCIVVQFDKKFENATIRRGDGIEATVPMGRV